MTSTPDARPSRTIIEWTRTTDPALVDCLDCDYCQPDAEQPAQLARLHVDNFGHNVVVERTARWSYRPYTKGSGS